MYLPFWMGQVFLARLVLVQIREDEFFLKTCHCHLLEIVTGSVQLHKTPCEGCPWIRLVHACTHVLYCLAQLFSVASPVV